MAKLIFDLKLGRSKNKSKLAYFWVWCDVSSYSLLHSDTEIFCSSSNWFKEVVWLKLKAILSNEREITKWKFVSISFIFYFEAYLDIRPWWDWIWFVAKCGLRWKLKCMYYQQEYQVENCLSRICLRFKCYKKWMRDRFLGTYQL